MGAAAAHNLGLASSADGIGTGDATLEGVTVEGRLLTRGGGSDSIHLTDTTIKGGIILNNPNTATRIVTDKSDLGNIDAQTSLILDGNADTVTANGDITVQGGKIDKIVLTAEAADAKVTIADGAEVTRIEVAAPGAAIVVEDGAKVGTVEANAERVSVSGDGDVDKVQANADNVSVTTPKTDVTAAEGTTGVTAGGEAVAPGESVSTGGSSTTIPGGSGIVTPADDAIEVDSWQALKQAIQEVEAGGTIRLTADITDAGADTTVVDGVSSATLPMEGEGDGKYFTLDGDGHTISAAKDKTFCFLIASVGGTTTVKDLTIDGASFSSKMGGAFFVEGGEALFQNERKAQTLKKIWSRKALDTIKLRV